MNEDVGRSVECVVCGRTKKPWRRSAPMELANGLCCDPDCSGYAQDPLVGDLWPGETREQRKTLRSELQERLFGAARDVVNGEKLSFRRHGSTGFAAVDADQLRLLRQIVRQIVDLEWDVVAAPKESRADFCQCCGVRLRAANMSYRDAP